LSAPIIETYRGSFKVYKVLQYGSTLLGATRLFYPAIGILVPSSPLPLSLKADFYPQVSY